jgi:putative endonuclease
MQFWVYILRCADGSYYAGHTEEMEARLWQHQQGINCDWTSRRRPVELVWCEATPTRYEALVFERRIKGWTRAKKEALIAGNWKRIGWLAKPPHERPPESVGPKRSAQRVVEARRAQSSVQRPSTSLRTNEPLASNPNNSVRAERRAEPVVEARIAQPPSRRPSTSLRTNEVGRTVEKAQ